MAINTGYARYVLATLMCVFMVHSLDRTTIALLLEPIGRDFALSDAQRGLLAGFAYAVPFALTGIPLGMLIDRVNRVRLLAILMAVWSGLTTLSALASGFGWLLLARIGIGAAESGGTPSNMSILADYFPPLKRSGAFGIYYMAPHIGMILGFALAGTVATAFGWRAAFVLVGVPGLLLVPLLLKTIREPRRGDELSPTAFASVSSGAHAQPPTRQSAPPLSEVMRALYDNRAVWHIVLGGTVASMVTAGTFTWLAPFLMRLHNVSVREAGFLMALGLAPFGALGSFAGGLLADRLGGYRSPRVALMLALALVVAIPAEWVGLSTASMGLLVTAFGVQQFAYILTNGPGYAAVVGLMPVPMRGVSAAVFQVSSNVFGFGVGAQLVGILSDALRVRYGIESLRYALMPFSLGYLWAAAHFALSARASASARDAIV